MSGLKVKVIETLGSADMLEADITAALSSISVASGTVPTLAAIGNIAGRSHIIILYQEG